jgi:type VII secretion-associated serine protease mycosin
MAWRTAAAVVVATIVLPAAPAYARAGSACESTPEPGRTIAAVPYEDRLYDPARLTPLATGKGVRVAVIDSGVDTANPQLHGRVVPGLDLLRNSDGTQDCVGHGTGVAGIIAAVPRAGVGFTGLAPGVTIVPVRVSEQENIGGKATGGDPGNAHDLAQAIRWAATTGHARVINMSLTSSKEGETEICAAVADAVRRNVVVVAAAGNDADKDNSEPFPAGCAGAIGVGAVGPAGTRSEYSRHGDWVALVATGDGITTTAPGSGQQVLSGTSLATPFVAATAALILDRFPDSTPADVAERLRVTADPAPGGRGDGYGAGLLNPYRALTETVTPPPAAAVAPDARRVANPALVAREHRRDRARTASLIVAAAGVGLVVILVAAAAILRRGRRRGWRPA